MINRAQLINSMGVLLVAGVFMLGSVLVTDRDQEHLDSNLEGDVILGELIDATESMVVSMNGRDSVTLLPGSIAEMQWDDESSHLDVDLHQGGVLFATQANDFTVSVETDFARVDSQESFAYVELAEDGNMMVYGLAHPSLVTFVSEGVDLNSLFVSDGMKMKVVQSKVSSTLERLRLTKLSKEFKSFSIEDTDISESVLAAWSESKLRYTESSVRYQQELRNDVDLGPSLDGFVASLNWAYEGFENISTVIPSAQERLDSTRKSEMLHYAMSNLLFGDKQTGEQWVSLWEKGEHELDSLESLYSDLFFVLPGDDLYPVKMAVGDLAFDQALTLSSLRREFLDVERLVERGKSVEAQTALSGYQSQLERALNAGLFDGTSSLGDLNREYLLLEHLLREHPDFYQVEFIDLLDEMEQKILALAGGDTDLNEERQAFVLSKIQFLTKLFDFVTERRIDVSTAGDIGIELLLDAQSYMALIPEEIGIRDWYQSELEKADLAISFINSPEFRSFSDFDAGLAAHEAKIQDLENLQSYIQKVRDGEEDVDVEVTLKEAEAQVRKDFTFNSISYLDAESQGDVANRLFSIVGGKVDTYSFESSYDRESGLLYDLVVDETVRFSTGVALEDLRDVITESIKELPETEEVEEVQEVSSLTEDFALRQVKDVFSDYEFETSEFEFEIMDLDNDTFGFDGLMTRYSVEVRGSYDLKTDKVFDVTWMFEGREQTMPRIGLSKLEAAIEAVYVALSS